MASPTEVAERVDECSSVEQAALLESEKKESGHCGSDTYRRSDAPSDLLDSPRKSGITLTAPSTGRPSRPEQLSLPKAAAVFPTPWSLKIADFLPQEFILWLGVILPSSVIVLILLIPPAEVAIDALPTPWHLLWVSLVPASNFLIWRRQWYGRLRPPAWLVHLNSLGIGISLIYTLKYLHLVLMGLVLAFFLIGLWAMAPALALLCSLACRGYLHGARANVGADRLPTLSLGLTLALLLLALPFVPAISSEYGLHLAVSDSQSKRQHGLSWLRRFVSRDDLLKSCYRESAPAIQWLGAALANEDAATSEQARTIYYRVTGKPLQSVSFTADSWHTAGTRQQDLTETWVGREWGKRLRDFL